MQRLATGGKRAERGYVEEIEASNVVIVDLMEPVPVVLLRTAALLFKY